MGDNIGTTITALLASVGQSKNAKRTAVAHSVFNISGSMVFLCIIPFYATFVRWISPKGAEIDVISRQIANAHTTFNIVCTLLWLPFIWVLVKIVTFIIRGEDEKKLAGGRSKYLDNKILNQPVFAIRMVTQEIEDMTVGIRDILVDTKRVIKENDARLLASIKETCETLAKRNSETLQYMAALFSVGSLTEEQAAYVSDMLIVLENLDHITNRCEEINNCCYEKVDKKISFSEDAQEEVANDISEVMKMYDKILLYLQGKAENPIREFNKEKERLVENRNKARKNNAKRMQQKACKKDSGAVFNQIIFSLERITHDCFNMLENNISQFKLEAAEEAE